jgi:hypothetical protein
MIDAGGFFANSAAGMTTKTRNRLIVAFILAFPFMVLFGFLVSQVVGPLPPIQPLPNPNGYDDFVKAGEMLSSDFSNDDYRQFSVEKLRVLMTKDAEALQIARIGLQKECRVPLDFSATSPAHLEELSAIKLVEHGFAAEDQLAEMENRLSDAVKSYLDMVRLANQSSYGGTLLDEMVGRTMEAIGTENLQKFFNKLDAKSCRETAEALETLDAQRQTWNEVMQQENNWSRRTYPGIRNEFARLIEHNSLEKTFQNAEQKYQEQQTKTRQLLIDLAARAYELDKGKTPASVADLVPDYLKTIPQDPFTGTNMVFSPR